MKLYPDNQYSDDQTAKDQDDIEKEIKVKAVGFK